jgi:hypothetical protein
LRPEYVDPYDPSVLGEFKQDMVFCWGGLAAENLFTGQDPRKSGVEGGEKQTDDEAQAAILACNLAEAEGNPDKDSEYMDQTWATANDILRANWRAVQALATALLRNTELHGADVVKIVESAVGPRVGDPP